MFFDKSGLVEELPAHTIYATLGENSSRNLSPPPQESRQRNRIVNQPLWTCRVHRKQFHKGYPIVRYLLLGMTQRGNSLRSILCLTPHLTLSTRLLFYVVSFVSLLLEALEALEVCVAFGPFGLSVRDTGIMAGLLVPAGP